MPNGAERCEASPTHRGQDLSALSVRAVTLSTGSIVAMAEPHGAPEYRGAVRPVRAAVVGVLGLGQADGDAVVSRSVLVKGCSCFSEVANLAYMRLWRHAEMCSWPAVIRMLLEVIFEQEYFDFLNLV